MRKRSDTSGAMSRENSRFTLNIPTGEAMEQNGHRPLRCPSPLLYGVNNLDISPRVRKRASSFKKPKSTSHHEYSMDFDEIRPRTSSMPTRNTFRKPAQVLPHSGFNIDPELETYTLRSFKMTSKGVIVNRGDSVMSRSTNSVFSSGSEVMCPMSPGSRTSSSQSRDSLGTSPGSVPWRVLVSGSSGVGKTAITQQFMTSEYLGGFDTSLDGEMEKTVSVLLDGEESILSFIDTTDEMEEPYAGPVEGHLVIYACDDRGSFDRAVDTLYTIRKAQRRDESIILVGNKSDLVRSRTITPEEAKAVAKTYESKFVETSVVLNVNVDELLVGIVKQIRLRLNDTNSGCVPKSKALLNKIFKKDHLSKSCENLYT